MGFSTLAGAAPSEASAFRRSGQIPGRDCRVAAGKHLRCLSANKLHDRRLRRSEPAPNLRLRIRSARPACAEASLPTAGALMPNASTSTKLPTTTCGPSRPTEPWEEISNCAGRSPGTGQPLGPRRCRRRSEPGSHPTARRRTLSSRADSELTTDVRSPSYDVAGYMLADLRLQDVTFSGGFRYDYIHIPFQNQLDPASDTPAPSAD